MKFIHCADLHLDSKIDGLPSDKSKIRRDEILRTFECLCDYASVNSVSAVIIAGDMFDTARVTTKTRDRVFNAIKKNFNVDFLSCKLLFCFLSCNAQIKNNTPNNAT